MKSVSNWPRLVTEAGIRLCRLIRVLAIAYTEINRNHKVLWVPRSGPRERSEYCEAVLSLSFFCLETWPHNQAVPPVLAEDPRRMLSQAARKLRSRPGFRISAQMNPLSVVLFSSLQNRSTSTSRLYI